MRVPKGQQSFMPTARTPAQKAAVLRKVDEAVLRGQREKRIAMAEAAAWIETVKARKAARL